MCGQLGLNQRCCRGVLSSLQRIVGGDDRPARADAMAVASEHVRLVGEGRLRVLEDWDLLRVQSIEQSADVLDWMDERLVCHAHSGRIHQRDGVLKRGVETPSPRPFRVVLQRLPLRVNVAVEVEGKMEKCRHVLEAGRNPKFLYDRLNLLKSRRVGRPECRSVLLAEQLDEVVRANVCYRCQVSGGVPAISRRDAIALEKRHPHDCL